MKGRYKRYDPVTPADVWAEWQQSSSEANAARQRMIDRQCGKARDVSAEDARKAMIERQRNNPTRRKYRDE